MNANQHCLQTATGLFITNIIQATPDFTQNSETNLVKSSITISVEYFVNVASCDVA